MLKGRYTCEQLKAIRSEIAKANDIDYTPSVCNYQGICRGTCPACEAERSYIEQELSLRQKAGKAVKIVGLASSLLALSVQNISAQERQEMNSDSLVWENYFFDFGNIKPENEQQIEEMTEFINEYPDKLFLVVGHTDARGSENYNLRLSLKRAEYVSQWLASRCNNKNIRIVPVGLAYFKPNIANTTDEVAHEQNRRASLEIYNPNRYNGKSAVLVELAIYKTLIGADTKLSSFEKKLGKLDAINPLVRSSKYDKLAKEIRKARETFLFGGSRK